MAAEQESEPGPHTRFRKDTEQQCMIYLDANATSRLRPEAAVIATEISGSAGSRNPSSVHGPGRSARSRLQNARKSVLRLLNRGAEDRHQRLIFTSGATEACNMMMFGFLGPKENLRHSSGKIILSAIEHPAVLEPAAVLERCGWNVQRILPEKNGVVSAEEFSAAVSEDTALVSLMAANNETGMMQPVAEVGRKLRSGGYQGPIVCDFTQALGKSLLSAAELFDAGMTAIAISGHKVGAPGGIGALIYTEAPNTVCFALEPMLRGGAQEQSLRGGTENLLGAVVFGEVCRLQLETLESDLSRKQSLRETLWNELSKELPNAVRLTGANSLSNTLLVRFCGCRGDDLVVSLDLAGVAASTGAACASGKQAISHVVMAMGLTPEEAREAVRFSIDWDTTEEDIERASAIIIDSVLAMMSRRETERELQKRGNDSK